MAKKNKWIVVKKPSDSWSRGIWHYCHICGDLLAEYDNHRCYVRIDDEIEKTYAHINCMRQVGEFRKDGKE